MTEPVAEILPRNHRNPEEVKLLSKFSLLIDEFVNFGTHVFKWEVDQARGGDENIPVQMMFRHILELGDSVSILVKESSIDPCKLQLRGMLESVLGLEYLLEKDTHNRAMGFMVWHHQNEVKRLKRLNSNDPSFANLSGKLKSNKYLIENISNHYILESENRIQDLLALLATKPYQAAESEYQRILALKKASKGKPKEIKWYELFGGPDSVYALADRLNKQGYYEFLYRDWSGPTHGTDVFDGKLFPQEGKDGNVAIFQIRFVKVVQSVVHYVLHILLLSYELMVENRIPDHKLAFTNWYLTIRQPYKEVISEKDLITIN